MLGIIGGLFYKMFNRELSMTDRQNPWMHGVRTFIGILIFTSILVIADPLITELSAQNATQPPQSEWPQLRLIEHRCVWEAAPHNAFTDLIRFQDAWWIAFREGQSHVSPDGALRIITSADGSNWTSAALITLPNADLRDAKLSITPTGQLMLSGAAAWHQPAKHTHQSLTWFSEDGKHWSTKKEIGQPNDWLWRTVWHDGWAYNFGYACGNPRGIRLYRSRDGKQFELWQTEFDIEGYPNETAVLFVGDQAYCLLRRDEQPESALWGRSKAPYRDWQWNELGVRMGGPQMIELPDGRVLAAVRIYQPQPQTVLGWIEPETGTWHEALRLPSGGDTSYAGMVWHDHRVYISYYSSHEQKTKIYWAVVELVEPKLHSGTAPTSPIAPLTNAHAHNDYYHQRPLLDALDCGFTSIEADVFLVDDQLLVGHSRAELRPERTLEALYLKPLRDRWQRQGKRWFESNPEIELWLHIDIKSEARTTFDRVIQQLEPYAELLARPQDQVETGAPLRIVISGNRDFQQIVDLEPRWAGIDGRIKTDLESELSAEVMPVVSDAWHTHFRWRGNGPMPEAESQRLKELVSAAHARGRKVRFWATPERRELWTVLLEAGVDFINTDRLVELRDFLHAPDELK